MREFNSFDERAKLFSLNREGKLSILAGLISVSGGANFLSDEHQSYNSRFLAAVYEKTLGHTSLLINELGTNDYAPVTHATHMVTGITNKTKVFITVEHTNIMSHANLTDLVNWSLGFLAGPNANSFINATAPILEVQMK